MAMAVMLGPLPCRRPWLLNQMNDFELQKYRELMGTACRLRIKAAEVFVAATELGVAATGGDKQHLREARKIQCEAEAACNQILASLEVATAGDVAANYQ